MGGQRTTPGAPAIKKTHDASGVGANQLQPLLVLLLDEQLAVSACCKATSRVCGGTTDVETKPAV